MQGKSKIRLQKEENFGFPGTGVTHVWKGYPGTTKPSVNNLCAEEQCHKGFAIGTNVLQDYQRQHYESVLKVIDVIPLGIVLPVTDIKSNKFIEAMNNRGLRARAKNKNKKDLLAYHVLYRLHGTLNSIYLLFLQAGIRLTHVSFPGTCSPMSLHCLCRCRERAQGW